MIDSNSSNNLIADAAKMSKNNDFQFSTNSAK